LIAAVAFSGFQQVPAPKNGKPNQKAAHDTPQDTNGHKKESGDSAPGRSPSDPATNQNVSVAAPQKAVDPVERIIRIIELGCTVALAIAGIIGIYIALKTLKAIELQARAMMDAGCALCLVDWENFIHLNPDVPNGVLAHAFRCHVKNVGKSPAFVEKVAARFIVIKSLDDLPPEPQYLQPRDLASVSEPLLVDQTYDRAIYAPIESNLSYTELEAEHRSGKCLLYAYGFVRYSDVYGREHETRYGLVYKSAPTPTRDIDRFYIDGPPAYNRQRHKES
jgi:hypothetical protein